MKFIQNVYQCLFNEIIEVSMNINIDFGNTIQYQDLTPQSTTGLPQKMLETNIMSKEENKNDVSSDSKPPNVRSKEEINKDKYEKIKDKLLKNFLNKKFRLLKKMKLI